MAYRKGERFSSGKRDRLDNLIAFEMQKLQGIQPEVINNDQLPPPNPLDGSPFYRGREAEIRVAEVLAEQSRMVGEVEIMPPYFPEYDLLVSVYPEGEIPIKIEVDVKAGQASYENTIKKLKKKRQLKSDSLVREWLRSINRMLLVADHSRDRNIVWDFEREVAEIYLQKINRNS